MNVEQDIHQDVIRTRSHPRWAPDGTAEPVAEWMTGAACLEHDPETWFPEGKGASVRIPKFICGGCSVRSECLTYALEHNERDGVWGGASPRQRETMRRRQRGAA